MALDDTMLATISNPISNTFNSFSKLSWIQSVFPIAASVSQPLSGHLTDIYGRRKGLMVCYFLFAIGTLLCGLAPSLSVFLLGRTIEGLGGGAIVSIVSFVESDIVPMRKRAFIEGLGNIGYGTVLALGGVYGGAINDAIGWKWAYLIQPPIIAVDAAVVFFAVKFPKQDNIHATSGLGQIDYFGILALVVAIILFQLGINSGGNTASWTSPLVLVSLIIAAVSLVIFVVWDVWWAKNPVLPIRLMLQRTVSCAQLSFFFASAANVTILFYVPIYLQVLGFSTEDAGLRFIPMAFFVAFSSAFTGYIVKITGRYWYINFLVQASFVLGSVLLCTMTKNTPSWAPFVYLALAGFGSGGAFVTRLMGVLSSVDSEKQAVIQAASWTLESIGLAFGLVISSTVFQNVSLNHLRNVLGNQPALLSRISSNFAVLQTLSGVEKQSVIDGYLQGTRAVFFLALAEMVLAAGISFGMQNNLIEDDESEKANE